MSRGWPTGDVVIPAPLLEEHWQQLRAIDIAPDAPDVQLIEMRKAFYDGAASLLQIATAFAAQNPAPSPADWSDFVAARLAEIETYLDERRCARIGARPRARS